MQITVEERTAQIETKSKQEQKSVDQKAEDKDEKTTFQAIFDKLADQMKKTTKGEYASTTDGTQSLLEKLEVAKSATQSVIDQHQKTLE